MWVDWYDGRYVAHMPKSKKGLQPTWTNVREKLAAFDRLGLMGLIQDLYDAHKENQMFLHARFGLGEDILAPYKETIKRCLWPCALRNQNTSVVRAKQAISSYKKASGEPARLAELMVFYCECAAGFCYDFGYQDESFFDALVRMFKEALKVINQLPAADRGELLARLDDVRVVSHNFGYGVSTSLDRLLAK